MEREFSSRKEANSEAIRIFLDSNREALHLWLYGNEITRLENNFPEIRITKGNPKTNRPILFDCTIQRK